MFVAKVTGSVVSTEKVESMRGQKLLVVDRFVWSLPIARN